MLNRYYGILLLLSIHKYFYEEIFNKYDDKIQYLKENDYLFNKWMEDSNYIISHSILKNNLKFYFNPTTGEFQISFGNFSNLIELQYGYGSKYIEICLINFFHDNEPVEIYISKRRFLKILRKDIFNEKNIIYDIIEYILNNEKIYNIENEGDEE